MYIIQANESFVNRIFKFNKDFIRETRGSNRLFFYHEVTKNTKESNRLQYFNYEWHEEHEGWEEHKGKEYLGDRGGFNSFKSLVFSL